MLFKLDSARPTENRIKKITEILEKGGLVIIPTDTIYCIICDINNKNAYKEICRIKGVTDLKASFSLIFNDLSHLSSYTLPVDGTTFKILKKYLPGPYTFILKANKSVPEIFGYKKKTVGIRIPDNNIPRAIVEHLGRPIIATSLKTEDEFTPHPTDPELIFEEYCDMVEMVVDSGPGGNTGSTVIDMSGDEPELIRQGIGEVDFL